MSVNDISYMIPIVWWNVSLSPPVSSLRGIASDEKINNIANVLQKFIDLNYALICLGEVSTSDVVKLSKALKLEEKGYSYAEGSDKQGRLYFDTAVFFHNSLEAVQLENGRFCEHSILTIGDRNLKIYEKYVFYHAESDEVLTIFLSHWPSRLKDNSLNVTEISIELRKKVHEYLDRNENVILMGDYNLEPYSTEIVNYLNTSRDRNYVSRKSKVLYNPCWNLLPISPHNTIHGTYAHHSNYHDWHILDQVMFSRSFLSEPWIINESLINIIDVNNLFSEEEYKNPSDHWPLSTIIFRSI